MGDGDGSDVYGRMSMCVRCLEMKRREFEEVWSTSAALERVPLVEKNATDGRALCRSTSGALTLSKSAMPAALAASESGSERSIEHGIE